jgi:hypothetical protein
VSTSADPQRGAAWLLIRLRLTRVLIKPLRVCSGSDARVRAVGGVPPGSQIGWFVGGLVAVSILFSFQTLLSSRRSHAGGD